MIIIIIDSCDNKILHRKFNDFTKKHVIKKSKFFNFKNLLLKYFLIRYFTFLEIHFVQALKESKICSSEIRSGTISMDFIKYKGCV